MLIAKRSLKYANLLPRIEFALLLMSEKHERTNTLSHLENPVNFFKSLIYNLYFIQWWLNDSIWVINMYLIINYNEIIGELR